MTLTFRKLQQRHHLSLMLFNPSDQVIALSDINANLMLSRKATIHDAYAILGTQSGQIRVDPTEVNRETSSLLLHSKSVDGTLWAGFNLDYNLPYHRRQIAIGAWVIALLLVSNFALWFTVWKIRRSAHP